MKKCNWILFLLVILISLPSHAGKLVLKEDQEILKIEDLENLIKDQNPTVKTNENIKKNLEDSKESIKDAIDDKRDIEDAIEDLDEAIDGLYELVDAQDKMIGFWNTLSEVEMDIDIESSKPELEEDIPDEIKDKIEEGIDKASGIYEAGKGLYQGAVGSQILTLNSVKGLYKSNIASLEQTRDSLKDQLDEMEKLPAQILELDKAILQIDMGEKSILWGAKNLYLGHAGLERQKKEIIRNLEILEVQIDIMKVQEELGMITSLDRIEVENQRNQIILGIKTMETQMDNLKRQINLILGQDINKDIKLEDSFILDEETISKINFEDDLSLVKKNSYSMESKELDHEIKEILMKWEDRYGEYEDYKKARREFENVEIEIKEEEKNIEISFTKLYEELQDKLFALTNERQNLDHIRQKDDILELKYALGVISKIELKQGKSENYIQSNLVKNAEQEVFQTLLQYKALVGGMDFSQ